MAVTENSRAEKILAKTQSEFNRAFNHAYIPRFVRSKIGNLLAGVELLESEDWNRHTTELSPYANPSALQEQISIESASTNALLVRPIRGVFNKRKIIVKRSYLETVPAASELFRDLLAEELAHGLSEESEEPIVEAFKEGIDGYVIAPFREMDELFDELDESKKVLFEIDEPVDPQRLYVATMGFSSDFFEQFPEPIPGLRTIDRFYFPVQSCQIELEETRAAIIQTVFEIIIWGMNIDPRGNSESQFNKGQKRVELMMTNLPDVYKRERAGFLFIDAWLTARGYKRGFESLFGDLSKKRVGDFIESLSNHEHDNFQQAFDLVCQEYNARGE